MEEKTLAFKLQIKDLLKMALFPILVYLGNYYFNNFHLDWYKNEHIDSYFHFMGGASIAFVANYLKNILIKKDLLVVRSKIIELILLVCVVAFTAVAWEIYELTYDLVFHTQMQPSNFDTIKDLFLGASGGAVLGLFFILKKHRQ